MNAKEGNWRHETMTVYGRKAEVLVLPVGAKVTVGDEIEGLVTQVIITERHSVSYKVAWWNGNVRNEAVLEDFEVRPQEDSRTRIGFQ